MATSLTLINAALSRTGSNPVTNLDTDTSAGGKIAKMNYEELVQAELSEYPWKFAGKSAQITLLDTDIHGDPPLPWTAAYQLPTDLVAIRKLSVGGSVTKYEVHGNTLLTSTSATDEVVLLYTWRPLESAWPAYFRRAIIARLEALFLRGVGERFKEATDRDEAAEKLVLMAKLRDSQSQTARANWTSPALQARNA